MPSGPGKLDRPFATSSVKVFVPLKSPFLANINNIEQKYEMAMMEKQFEEQFSTPLTVSEGSIDLAGAKASKFVRDDIFSHFVSADFQDEEARMSVLKRVVENIQDKKDVENDEVLVQTAEPVGMLFETPRPLLSSDIVFKMGLDISDSEDFMALSDELRRNKLETMIRKGIEESLGDRLIVDVKMGPAFTFVSTRKGVINYELLLGMSDGIKNGIDDTDVRLATQLFIFADG